MNALRIIGLILGLLGVLLIAASWFRGLRPETQRAVAHRLGAAWRFLRAHGQELVGIPAALVVFYGSGLLLQWFAPASGLYDPGLLHRNAVILVSLLIGGSIARFGASLNVGWFTKGQKEPGRDRQWLFIIFLAAWCWLSSMALSAAPTPVTIGPPCDRGASVVQAASHYDGVREATGRNDGTEVERILGTTGLPKGNAWCGAFVFAVMRDAGVGLPGGDRAYAWAPTWHPAARRVWTRSAGTNKGFVGAGPKAPMPGDVFGLHYPKLGRIGHVGIVEQWAPIVVTWEGNTNDAGSREGDGVYRKRRSRETIHCVSRWAC